MTSRSRQFYDDCFSSLATDGVLAVKLHHDDAAYPVRSERIRCSFGGNAVEVLARAVWTMQDLDAGDTL